MIPLLSWSKELYTHWNQDRITSLSAALAYYTLFSLIPILLVGISVAGSLFGEEAARGQILQQISGLVGKQTALEIQQMLQRAHHPDSAITARIISIFILLFSASGVFSEIQEGLNSIWGVQSAHSAKWYLFIKRRFLSFAMVLISAFLLLVSLVISALLATLNSRISYFIGTHIIIELILNELFSFFIATLLFAMMFKNLPDVELNWGNVWVGALITSLLFSLGRILIGFYLNQTSLTSLFGAASSLIVILLWVYYSAQIFFIGAEITKIYSHKKSFAIKPTRNALEKKQKNKH